MSRLPLAPLLKFLSLAVVVVLATTVLALTIANAQGGRVHSYKARFTDASGLLPDDDVRIAGVVVGRVQDVRIVDRNQAEVTFGVAAGQPVPASAEAVINYRNLVGQRYLQIETGTGPVGERLEPGATIPVQRTRGPLNLTVLFNGFRPLFTALDPEQVNTLSFEIVQTLQGQGGTVRSLLAATSSLTDTVADRDEVVGQVVDNLTVVLGTLNAGDQRVAELISSLQALVSGLDSDREPIGEAIVSINDLTRTTAGFLDQARPPLTDDIAALGELADNLDRNSETVDEFLRLLPRKLNTISRAGSYASWFNFYLCGLDGLNLRFTPEELAGTLDVPVEALPQVLAQLPPPLAALLQTPQSIDAPNLVLPTGDPNRCSADPDQDGITDVEDLPRSGAQYTAPLSTIPPPAQAAVDLPLVVGN
jgi:phospholipid/cholesterol/gamma-HCH transport system substrate-binding protein